MTTEVYEFAEEFQTLIIGYLFRDVSFNVRTDGLVKPEYFESEVHAALAAVAQEYYQTYKTVPSRATLSVVLKDAIDRKKIRAELKDDVKAVLECAYKETLADVDSTVDLVAKFARKQALTRAIIECAALIDKGDFDKVEEKINKATLVGVNRDADQYDFFGEAENRQKYRHEVMAGHIKPSGITTGHKNLDNLLYHKGWGRKELSVIMGAAKAGKSMSLLSFALKACLAGHNVLYVSLEVATRIIADRMDANLSATKIDDLVPNMKKALDAAILAKPKAGALKIHDYPSGTMSPGDLRRLLHRYEAVGMKFDLVIVDYADLMRPDRHHDDARENSRMIYIGLRALAQEFNMALLSATQTNREGMKQAEANMTHVSDDINKVRTVDLLLGISATEDEKEANKARMYFVASRNQAGKKLEIKTNMAMARFFESIEEMT